MLLKSSLFILLLVNIFTSNLLILSGILLVVLILNLCLNKNLKIIQRSDYFNFSIDSLLISEFVSIKKYTKKILDLGTGNAAIPLFLSKKTSAKIYGIEIQEISYNLALRNININNLNEQIYIIYDNMKNYLKHFN